MKTRVAAGIAVALASILTMSACSSSGSGSDQSASKLTWSMWVSGSDDEAAWQKVADAVKAKDGITVKLQGTDFTNYWTKLNTQLSTGSAQCIVSLQSLRAANYVDQLRPMDDYVTQSDLSGFASSSLDGMKVDGKLYGLPYDNGPLIVFYNKDMFDKLGVPVPKVGWTVDDFMSAAKAFKKAGKTLFATTIEDMNLESEILGYNGGRVIDANGELTPDDPKFAAGLDWLGGLVKDGYAMQASNDGAADDNEFVNQQVGMYVDGPWSLISMKSTAKFTIGVATVPRSSDAPSTFAAGSGFGISKKCAYPKQAAKAIKTMTSEEVLQQLASSGRAYPARTAAQPAYVQASGITGAGEVLKQANAQAVPLPGNKQSDQLGTLFGQYAVQAVNGQTSGADAMKQIASQLGQ